MPKYDLTFSKPLMNAAGFLGFAPEMKTPVEWDQMGAFITNPVSLGSRTPAVKAACLPFPGGFLLHSGLPNPGLDQVIRRYAPRWGRSPVPVIVHLILERLDDARTMVRKLERVEGVSGIEIGFPPDINAGDAAVLVGAVQGELPVIASLPLDRWNELANGLSGCDLAAFSLGAPRGTLMDGEGRLVTGRLYGPSLFPLGLQAVKELSKKGVSVIGSGGIYRQEQVNAVLAVGAAGVQLDGVLWKGTEPA